MNSAHKCLLLAVGAGAGMTVALWLFIDTASPFYRYLLDRPELGYAVMILNLPVLFAGRMLSGMPPSATPVYLACFLQWCAIGYALSLAVWRSRPVR
jgi:hypothetical protein